MLEHLAIGIGSYIVIIMLSFLIPGGKLMRNPMVAFVFITVMTVMSYGVSIGKIV
jgi:hypothetical protein